MASTYLDRVENKALGQMLIEKGALSEAQVNEALDQARSQGVRLGEALVEMGYIGTDALSYTIAEQYGQRPMELHPSMVDTELLSSFSDELLISHMMLPLIEMENTLVVVVADPTDEAGLDALALTKPGIQIAPQLGDEGQIRRCLQVCLPGAMAEVFHSDSRSTPEHNTPVVSLETPASFNGVPAPGSPDFLKWVMSTAAANEGQELYLRRRGGGVQVCLADGSEIALWQPVEFSRVLWELLANASAVPFTQNQAWRLSDAGKLGDIIFDFIAAAPVVQGQAFVRVCAVQRERKSQTGDAETAGRSAILPKRGECLIVNPGKTGDPAPENCSSGPATVRQSRPTSVAIEYGTQVARTHQVIIISSELALATSHALPVYPAPLVDILAATQAHASECVVLDFLPSQADFGRLMLSMAVAPGVVIFADVEKTGASTTQEITGWPGVRRVELAELFTDGGQSK